MTLMEIVLAITIVVMMMGGVYAFYAGALDTRDKITATVERLSAVRAVMDRMTRELRAAKVFAAPKIDVEDIDVDALAGPGAGVGDISDVAAGADRGGAAGKGSDVITMMSRLTTIGMDGDTEQVAFPTVSLPGPSAGADGDATEAEQVILASGDFELVGYRLRLADGETGEIIGLERSRKKEMIVTDVVEDEDENTEWVLVSPHVKFLHVRYWEGADWIESWAGGDMPAAVEITLGFQPLPEDYEPEDYPYEIFRRVIYIPSADTGRRGTVVRGLGGGTSR